MRYAEAQLLQMFAWVLRDHAMITSGAYKIGAFDKSTEIKRLNELMQTMNQHCLFVSDCVEALGEVISEETKKSK